MSEPNDKGRWESFLQDEIVINILSRLHPKDVLRCRCVVKKWRDLTSTPYFVDLHKQRGIAHVILVDVPKRKEDQRDQYFLDKWWITSRKKPAIQKFHSHPLYSSAFSQDGLLVMTSSCKCSNEILIVNPIFREKVKIFISKEWHSKIHKVYGVYFNPTLKEYCALLGVTSSSSIIGQLLVPLDSFTVVKQPITYKMLTLGPKPCLRDIRNPYKDRYPSLDLNFKHPAIVDGFLYWLIDLEEGNVYADIMEFDTRSDEFKLMRCPAPMRYDHRRFGLDLLNIDGFLSLVLIAERQVSVDVNIWTLKDRASESWTSSQYFVYEEVYPPGKSWDQFETIAVRCGEILIRVMGSKFRRSKERLYVCNLEFGSAKVLGKKIYKGCSKFFSHDTCLSSLKNCNPVIRIGNGDKCLDCNRLEKEETSSSNSAGYEQSDVVEEITISGADEGAESST